MCASALKSPMALKSALCQQTGAAEPEAPSCSPRPILADLKAKPGSCSIKRPLVLLTVPLRFSDFPPALTNTASVTGWAMQVLKAYSM